MQNQNDMPIVTYINHSGFLLETEKAYFLFDYYTGDIPEMNPEKSIVVFVSHRHSDHYNPAVFSLIEQYPEIRFVLSKDVPVKRELARFQARGFSLQDHITVVRRNQTVTVTLPRHQGDTTLEITGLRSTDAGVAYLLRYEEHQYYHAGDLNLWVWEEESRQYNNNMRANFYRELEQLKGLEIDVAFVPLDPRQGKEAFGGLEAFLEYTDTRKAFPMHCWGEYDIIDRFLRKHPEYEKRIVRIMEPGQSF